jgi:hypothetical protein
MSPAPRASARVLRLLVAAVLVLAGPAAVLRSVEADDIIPDVHRNPANGHYYKLYVSSGDWTTANAAAEALDGYLVTLTSQAEQDWVKANVGYWSGDLWLGCTDAGHEGTWTWVTGEPWAWANWNTNEPNNSGGAEHVAEWYSSGKWNDIRATNSNPAYVVEWNTNPNAPPPPVAPAAPTNLTATLGANGTIGLQWSDQSDNESEFDVERSTPEDPWARIARPGVDATTFQDTYLKPLVEYTYRVRARNIVGPSDWTNEATATSGAYVPYPVAPSEFQVTGTTRDTVDLSWSDDSDGETSFEIHRRTGGADFAHLFTTPPDATSYQDSGLPPDTYYAYAVRSVGTLQTSSFVQTEGTTLPTLTVTCQRGDLKDSPKFGRDSFKATLTWAALPNSDGEFDPIAEGIVFLLGNDEAPLGLMVGADDFTWKGKKAKKKWKSPKGFTPRMSVKLNLDTGVLTVVVKKAEFSAPAVNPVRVSLRIGDDAGTERGDWEEKKPGYLRLR